MVLEAVEEDHEVLFVFSRSLACHQDIVQVHEQEVQVLEDGIHKSLKSLGGILKPKGHTEELKKSKRGDHRRHRIIGVDQDLVITADEVDFTEDDFAGQGGRKVMDARNWVPVVLGDAIELAEVARLVRNVESLTNV